MLAYKLVILGQGAVPVVFYGQNPCRVGVGQLQLTFSSGVSVFVDAMRKQFYFLRETRRGKPI